MSWFKSNLLILNFNKTHYVEFRMKHYYQVKTKVKYKHTNISNSTETKFLGLINDETLSRLTVAYKYLKQHTSMSDAKQKTETIFADGKHVKRGSWSFYWNYKGFNSLVLKQN